MTIEKTKENDILTIVVKGRIDTNNAGDLDKVLESLDGVNTLIFDLKDLEYISSAGLRILLNSQKRMNEQGNMIIKNAKEEIVKLFKITGFIDLFTLE